MRVLIDSNIVLEVLLGQEKAGEAQALLSQAAEHEFFVSDYSLHSIGLLLFRRNQHAVFEEFVDDVMVRAGVMVAALLLDDMSEVVRISRQFALDFDDAYQYAAAGRYGLTIVSFDSDFDHTERGRKTPAEALRG